MSATVAAPVATDKPARSAGSKVWLVIASVLAGAVIAGFYGINEYASGTSAVIAENERNAARFNATFTELVQARYRALNLAADTMLQSRVTVAAFANRDRAALGAIVEPFFAALQRDHGIDGLNFWTAPAIIFYRAGAPDETGVDLSRFRRSIVAANERRTRISAVETGLGGLPQLRAIVPVIHQGNFVGVMSFASSFAIPLDRARAATGLDWAFSITREISERTERVANPRVDAWQGDDVYTTFSDPATGATMRAIRFNPRTNGPQVVQEGGRTIFVTAFPITNFAGQPTITVANVRDVTADFADVLRSVVIKSGIVFLLIAGVGSLAGSKFREMGAGFAGTLGRQRKELADKTAQFEAAQAKLREVDLIKRGFFNNLVTAVSEPLQAVTGHLASVAASADDKALAAKLAFPVAEIETLGRLVADYHQIELFRQSLVKGEAPLVRLADIAGQAIDEDIATYRRLPQLTIAMAVPTDLPETRADAGLLRRAIGNLVGFAAQRAGRGRIDVTGQRDEGGWLVLRIVGSAFTGPAAVDDAVLDESRQFMARLATGDAGGQNRALVGLVLARTIIEFFGGTLEPASDDAPGFVVRLPAAA